MNVLRYLKPVLAIAVVGGLLAAGYLTRDSWLPWLRPAKQAAPDAPDEAAAPATKIIVNEQAQKNLGLTDLPAGQLKAQKVWKTIQVPGMVVDRPGRSDRAVVTPVTGVVGKIHAVPGDTVKPREPLFELRVTSEFVMNAQAELFRQSKRRSFRKRRSSAWRRRAARSPRARSPRPRPSRPSSTATRPARTGRSSSRAG